MNNYWPPDPRLPPKSISQRRDTLGNCYITPLSTLPCLCPLHCPLPSLSPAEEAALADLCEVEEVGEREEECWEDLEERLPPSGASEAGVPVSARVVPVRDTIVGGGGGD